MKQITLTDDQVRLISQADGRVEFRDAAGRHLGFLSFGFTDVDIELAKRSLASDEPRYTTAEVIHHLNRLATS